MSAIDIDSILQTFRTRRNYYATLLKLSQNQQKFIATDDYTQLLSLLDEKQQVLSRLEELHQQQPQLIQQWKECKAGIDPLTRSDAEHLLAEMEAILTELKQEEHLCTNNLIEKKTATEQSLQEVNQGENTHDAYRDQLGTVTHRYLNLET